MNRSQINLILGVLLFPITDPGLQANDYFFDYYHAYKELISIKGISAKALSDKEDKIEKYRKAEKGLIRYLANACRSRIQSYDDLQLLCEMYYPLHAIDREFQAIQLSPEQNQKKQKEHMALFYMERMQKIAKSLLTYRDGILAIRTWNNRKENGETDIFYSNHVFDKVEIWNMLCSFVSPDFFMTLFIVESGAGKEALYGQKVYISLPDKLLVKVLRKGMAENHLHFNAGFDYETVWLNKMNLCNQLYTSRSISDPESIQNVEAAVFRLLSAIYFSGNKSGDFISWIKEYKESAFISVMGMLYKGEENKLNMEQLSQTVWKILNEETVRNHVDYLIETIFHPEVDLKTSSEFILLYECFQYMRKYPEDTGFANIFLQYVRIKNNFIKMTQQSNLIPGLRNFQKYFNQMKQEERCAAGKDTMILDVFHAQSKITGLKKLEIRITPDVEMKKLYNLDENRSLKEIREALCKQLFQLFRFYRQYILEDVVGVQNTKKYLRKEQELIQKGMTYRNLIKEVLKIHAEKLDKTEIPVLGIVFHFAKSESIDDISGYYCWRGMDYCIGNNTNHKFFLRERMASVGIAIERLRIEFPLLNEYIVGVDAASDENAMEPWMFSQAFLKMRSRSVTRPVGIHQQNNSYYNIQNIGFTYHVGEDYRHIVSGLRHIDEVIEHFCYKSGDRLGHALALGINIHDWIRNTETTVMPIQEYMENLLWIWGKSIHEGLKLPVKLEILEEKILLCAEKIYKNISGITVRLLYQAYEKKFSPSHRELLLNLLKEEKNSEITTGEKIRNQRKDPQTYCRVIDAHCIGYEGLWTLERLVSANYCPVFEERGRKVEMVPVRENELALYETLQQYMLEKISRKGIYIETNPTSNLNIGNMQNLLEHPIFRMHPLYQLPNQGQKILVTINSDDPAVFNTNVENELAYVYYALEHAGYPKADILEWIDTVRKNGMDGSFITRKKDCKTLLDETSSILDLLKKFL